MIDRWSRLAELLVGGTIVAAAYVAVNVLTPYFLAFTVPLLIIYFALVYRRKRRFASRITGGLCPKCGYDLRATPGRCPACGNPPTPA